MTFTRAAGMVGGGALLAAWFASAAGTRFAQPDGGARGATRAQTVDQAVSTIEAEANRLRDVLNTPTVYRQVARNPFAFAEPRPQIPEGPSPEPPRPVVTDMPIAQPRGPLVKLSGIAEDTTADGVVRTAVLSIDGHVFLAKEGDELAGRYSVVKIGAEVVELRDHTSGSAVRLALR